MQATIYEITPMNDSGYWKNPIINCRAFRDVNKLMESYFKDFLSDERQDFESIDDEERAEIDFTSRFSDKCQDTRFEI